MTILCAEVLNRLQGKTLVTAESCTGGGIGTALTSVPGSSAVYKGGVISYTNWVKQNVLGVDPQLLDRYGAVSIPVAEAMASGVRKLMQADIAVSVTGLAGPGGDEFGHPVGMVCIGYASENRCISKCYQFDGSRDRIRNQTIKAALQMLLEYN